MELAKFEGDVYIGRIADDGSFGGYFGPLECDSFLPSRTAGDKTDIKSKRRNIYDQSIYTNQAAGSNDLKMVFKEIPSDLLSLVFAANIVPLTVVGGTVTAETVVAGDLGKMVRLAKPYASAIVVKDSTAATTYVLGTDYSVLPGPAGISGIIPLEGGDIAAGDTLKVSYTNGSYSADQFDGETVTSANCMVFFDGKNRISGKDFTVEYYHVNIPAPADMFDLLSSDLVTVTLDGSPTTPAGKTAPYRAVKVK